MQIAGIQKTTLVDYPGKIAATVFTRGCSFRCPFCHNPELVVPEKFLPLISEDEILDFLESRIGKLQAVCITGGEPTLQKDLPEFIHKLKEMDYLVKLDSNGWNPEILEKNIKSEEIDYIAMDIKSSLEKYSLTTGTKVNIENIQKSIKLIMESGIDYEFRTTVCHPLHEVADFEKIGEMISGAKRYFIQNFVKSKHVDEHENFESFSDIELKEAKEIMEKYIKEVKIR